MTWRLQVNCDNCGDEDDFPTVWTDDAQELAEARGWVFVASFDPGDPQSGHRCPACQFETTAGQ